MDGGDLLFAATNLEGSPLAGALKERARFMARGLVRMGVAAVNVGRRDLATGLGFVEALGGGESPVPWVSANLKRRGGERPFPRWRIVPWGSGRAAVFGLLRPDPPRDAALGLEVEDPSAAAAAVLRDLPPVDAVVCLSNLGFAREEALVKQVPGIRVIVGGGSNEFLPEPRRAGSAWLLHATDKGQLVGVLDVHRAAAGPDWGAPGLSHRFLTLDASIPDDPKVAGWLAVLKGEASAPPPARKKAAAAAPPTAAPAPAAAPSRAAPPPPRLAAGSTTCRECHAAPYRAWLGTRHARAYLSLSGTEREGECADCHGSTLQKASEVVREPVVGCEECHGPAAGHRGKGGVQRKPPESVCRRCHRGYHKDEKLDLPAAYEKIRCDRKN